MEAKDLKQADIKWKQTSKWQISEIFVLVFHSLAWTQQKEGNSETLPGLVRHRGKTENQK